jgi:hypothetical protein
MMKQLPIKILWWQGSARAIIVYQLKMKDVTALKSSIPISFSK